MYKKVKIILPDGSERTGKIDTAIAHSKIEASILKAYDLPESDYTIRNFKALESDEPILIIDKVDFKI